MNAFQRAVAEFHEATGGPGTLDTPEGRELRAKLIMEEAVETVAALGFRAFASIEEQKGLLIRTVSHFERTYPNFDLLDFIDGLCDLTYVVMGGAVNADISMQRHFDEVHAANMRKLTGPKREDGKQLKPEGWVGPDHRKVLDQYYGLQEQQRRAEQRHEELLWDVVNGN